jgi:AraC-like DNA-binding protein/effector-binding domain-containing protein
MQKPLNEFQPIFAYIAAHLDQDVSLGALARKAKISPYHLHHVFSASTGETPKQLALRLRLGRAAVLLLISDDSVLDIALSCGFDSHEVFCRAFRRRFGTTPSQYRQRGFATPVDTSHQKAHALFVGQIGPCVSLYHLSEKGRRRTHHMSYTVTKIEIVPQPVIIGRKRVKRSEIAQTIAQVLSQVFQFAQQRGIALTGLPFTRYVEVGPGLITMEPGMRVAGSSNDPLQIDPSWLTGTEDIAVRTDVLPGGPAAFTLHKGAYDKLPDAFAAVEEWIEREGLVPAGPPWESYVTDPAEYPNPADWKTEIFWPLKA